MDVTTIRQCMAGSYSGELKFPQVVQRLSEAGIERYHVDLVRHETTYYDNQGKSHREPHPELKLPPVDVRFTASGVQDAVRASQRQEINYPEFLRQALVAGTSDYVAYLTGRQVIYSGRQGDFHIERFPD